MQKPFIKTKVCLLDNAAAKYTLPKKRRKNKTKSHILFFTNFTQTVSMSLKPLLDLSSERKVKMCQVFWQHLLTLLADFILLWLKKSVSAVESNGEFGGKKEKRKESKKGNGH